MTTATRPTWLAVEPSQIPERLRALPRWVVWRAEYIEEKEKWTKEPYQAEAPAQHAATNKPATWATFDAALAAYTREDDLDGVGYVLDWDDPIVGIDLDHCCDRESGVIEPWAQAIVERLATYAEFSPSGTGLRLFAYGELPEGRRKDGKIELYDDGRYLTITGHHLAGTPSRLENRLAVLGIWHAELFPPEAAPTGHPTRASTAPPTDDDAALLDQARRAANGSKFRALYDHGNTTGYASASEADLGLSVLLAFWTQKDIGRMDRLFRASALCRKKWDESRGAQTYGAKTLAVAIAKCVEIYEPFHGSVVRNALAADNGHLPDEVDIEDISKDIVVADKDILKDILVEAEDIAEDIAVEIAPYSFHPAFATDHFVNAVVNYLSGCTDAALEYHEAAALVLLASMTPGLRFHAGPYVGGLPTNLYVLFVGDSTTSRKTTVKDHCRDLQHQVLPASILPDQFSPEAFLEQLAARPHAASTWHVDEFRDVLVRMDKVQHMAGLRQHLLTLYAGTDFRYTRHSKRDKKSGLQITDEDVIKGPHLSILGCTTPTVFDQVRDGDVVSGLLPRFAVIWPSGKPPRRPFYTAGVGANEARAQIVAWMTMIHDWTITRGRTVRFEAAALDRLDAFDQSIEAQSRATPTEVGKLMLQRLTAMAVKVAMLAAVGHPASLAAEALLVREADAAAALVVLDRWRGYAVRFVDQVGASHLDRVIDRCLRMMGTQRRISRRQVAQKAHVSKKMLDAVEETLIDRGVIHRITADRPNAGVRGVFWERLE